MNRMTLVALVLSVLSSTACAVGTSGAGPAAAPQCDASRDSSLSCVEGEWLMCDASGTPVETGETCSGPCRADLDCPNADPAHPTYTCSAERGACVFVH